MDRSLIEKKILDILKQNPNRLYKPRALFKKIGLRETHYRNMKIILSELFKEGKIEKKGHNQYGLRRRAPVKTGVLSITSRGFGFVETKDGSEIFIHAQKMLNAFHLDIVRIRISKTIKGARPEGQVIEVLKRHRTEFVGQYHIDRYGEWVIPDDKRIRSRFVIDPKTKHRAIHGQMVSIELVDWPESDPEPTARIKEILGFPGEPGLDAAMIIRQHDLPVHWSDKAIEQSESITDNSIGDEAPNRLDLRRLACFTIDPQSAQDYDDAVSIEKSESAWSIGVHIADVSHYVRPGTPIDREARKRGTSVYLTGRVIHMLPPRLASEICSLKPGVDRLTISCIMQLNLNGDVTDIQIKPSIIRSKQRFTYQEVQHILDGQPHPYADDLHEMEKVRKILFKARKKRGSVDIDIPEPVIDLDEKGYPVAIKPSKRLNSHRIVEEFMLLANRVVAELLLTNERKTGRPGIYRVHEPPKLEDVSKLRTILKKLGIDHSLGSTVKPIEYQGLVESVRESPFRHFIEKIALRSMSKAKYGIKNLGHFGLAFHSYTHFTSPIRRYPDLVVHRLIRQYSDVKPHTKTWAPDKLAKLAEHCSARERVAVDAERDHLKMKQLQYLSKHVGDSFHGVISGVMHYGFYVELADSFVEGLIHVHSLDDDYYEYFEDDYFLRGRRHRKTYRLGDPVHIQVTSVSVAEGMADFILISDE